MPNLITIRAIEQLVDSRGFRRLTPEQSQRLVAEREAFMDSDHFEESAFKRKGFLNAQSESPAQQFQSVKAPQQLFCRELSR